MRSDYFVAMDTISQRSWSKEIYAIAVLGNKV